MQNHGRAEPLLSSLGPVTLAEVLSCLEDPVLVVDRDRKILFQNPAAKTVTKATTGIGIRNGRLVFSTQAANEWLEYLVSSFSAAPPLVRSRGHRLPRRAATRDWLVVLSSIHALKEREHFVVHLVSRLHPRSLPEAALKDLFGLTRREMEIVVRLSRSERLRQVAGHMKLSHETVRAYLKRVLRKCGVRSQTELLCLTQRISLFHGPEGH